MAVTFASNDVTIRIANPDLGDVLSVELAQAVGRDAAGGLYVYDQGPTWKRLKLRFSELRESEKNGLQNFFEAEAEGALNSFTFTDWRGAAWTARFTEPKLEFTAVGDQTAEVGSFQSGEITGESSGSGAGTVHTYPTTRRSSGVWSVEFELEVAAA